MCCKQNNMFISSRSPNQAPSSENSKANRHLANVGLDCKNNSLLSERLLILVVLTLSSFGDPKLGTFLKDLGIAYDGWKLEYRETQVPLCPWEEHSCFMPVLLLWRMSLLAPEPSGLRSVPYESKSSRPSLMASGSFFMSVWWDQSFSNCPSTPTVKR